MANDHFSSGVLTLTFGSPKTPKSVLAEDNVMHTALVHKPFYSHEHLDARRQISGRGYDMSPVEGPIIMFRSLDATELDERRVVKALGGHFRPIFNYRREILGYLKEGLRCYVCSSLCSTHMQGGNPLSKKLGVWWCLPCLTKYTISKLITRSSISPVLTWSS
jgi:hypothetical protein